MKKCRWGTAAALIALTLCYPAYSQEVAGDPALPAPAPMDMTQVIALLQQQQKELAEQSARLDAQANKITALTQELDTLRAAPGTAGATLVATDEVSEQSSATADSAPITLEPATSPTAETALAGAEEKTKSQQQKRDEGEAAIAQAQTDDPTQDLLSNFPGAWRLHGTNAAFGIGGYIRTTVVLNEDVLEIPDRFIVGSIPVDQPADGDNAAQSSITANQSRLNFDMRDTTSAGILRAFIEGDFTGDGDSFRLRHAFGQWDRVLAGQTWSAFVDTEASPEEVDFEGLNGRVNVRQSQVRWSPPIGEEFQLQLSLEDPNPQIQNGSGVTRVPDLVLAGRFTPHQRLHLKAALLGRQIRGQQAVFTDVPGIVEAGGVDKSYAWGLSLSGSFSTPMFDNRDKFLFQLNHGNGIGRYVNDLNSIGNYDGIFNPKTDELQLFDVTAGYGSLQHWWDDTMRSNFTLGFVDINNPGFVDEQAYKRTIRASANILWNPTKRVDTGVEYLWGRRENKSGDHGDAQQIQMMVRYLF